jgi:enediyne polyketide synthase
LSEDTLPGGLSNTIAGRICNYFDFKGGGYVVDGACASSLLAVINGCSALLSHDVDVAVCGGVDLSLDPFELVGFARNGALATDEMRVFDRNPTGFLPGEGSGFVVMMRQEDAKTCAKPIHAVIRGWGISSDGQGGMTRPEPQGQLLALKRAYERAALCPSDAGYFEAHGTGTAAGDTAELTALRDAMRDGKNRAVVVGSVKANIGHTKAAAGIAGLLKTVMALASRVIPPTTGCIHPHAMIDDNCELLRVQRQTSPWPSDRDLIAGVSAMGFGGINTHIVLQSVSSTRSLASKSVQVAGDSHQDAELLIFSAETPTELQADLEKAAASAASLSQGELSDLSANLIQSDRRGPWRAAAVASSPDELSHKLRRLLDLLTGCATSRLLFEEGVFLSGEARELRLCILFPGQGIPYCTDNWPFYQRIAGLDPPVSPVVVSAGAGETEKAQFGISLQCLKQLRILGALGIRANSSVGHSLGELIALHWAGAMTETELLELACLRGRLMHEAARCSSRGAMVAVMATAEEVINLLRQDVVVAARNGSHIVLSGPEDQIAAVECQCQQKNIRTVRLPVEYAFHSRAFAPAAQLFERELNLRRFERARRSVFSTVTGNPLASDANLASHLAKQIVNPVLFENAVSHAARSSDVFLELGSEGVLAGMVAAVSQLPVVGWTPDSVKGILRLAGSLYVGNSSVDLRPLVESRYCRRFSLEDPADFLRSPCSTSKFREKPQKNRRVQVSRQTVSQEPAPQMMCAPAPRKQNCDEGGEALDTLLQIVSRQAELPLERLSPSMNLLTDLHLSSIAVAQIAIEAAKSLGKTPLSMPMSAATKTIEQLAAVLTESSEANSASEPSPVIQGIDSWVGIAVVEQHPVPKSRLVGNAVAPGNWTIAGATSAKARAIATAVVETLSGDGVLLLYDASTSMDTALRTAQEVCRRPRQLLVVCDAAAPPVSAFIRSVAVEADLDRTALLRIDFDDDGVAQHIIEESRNTARFTDVHILGGQRFESVLRFLSPDTVTGRPFVPGDNLLVLGGGKGIAAECAFEMARKYGLSLALVGRSSPSSDKELSSNLARLANFGIRFRYLPADVTNPTDLSSAVQAMESDLGPITAVLHAAGINEPKALSTLTMADIERTLRPKLMPLEVLDHCLDFHHLKAFIAFGSIIARIGFHGEAHYAHANELMRERIEALATLYKECRFLCLEWSAWSGLGMGERLARLDSLIQQGIAPLTPEMGTDALFRALEGNIPASSAVVTSRIPSLPTLKISKPAFKPSRFLERTLVDYPEMELIAESDLAAQKDLYLNDHKLDGTPVFPAALGLEAMVQAATALFRGKTTVMLSDVRFASPITVVEGKETTIRIAALRRSASTVHVTIRSSQTGFQIDHFRATCSLDPVGAPTAHGSVPSIDDVLKCEELYGSILFQRGRFQAVKGYVEARARSSCAVLSPTERPWFSQFLPQSLRLINPAIMDAAMHSIQACIPHKRLVPTAIDRITIYPGSAITPPFICRARERSGNGDDFLYDLQITDREGIVLQCWDGLALHAIAANDPALLRTPELIANMLERRWSEIAGDDDVKISLQQRESLSRSVAETSGRRADGKPMPLSTAEARAWSDKALLQLFTSHEGSCDLERVTNRDPLVWHELLGEPLFQSAAFLARQQSEGFDLAATRVWSIAECLKKLGKGTSGAVTFEAYTVDRWAISRGGNCLVGTVPITVSGEQTVAAFAVRLTKEGISPHEVNRAVLSV